MKLEYNQKKAAFDGLAKQLNEHLKADAVMVVVLGRPISGCCCDIRPLPPEHQQWLGEELVRNLRAIADALEADLNTNVFPANDNNQHEQTLN